MSSAEVILVTGANTGLGFEIIRALCSSGKTYDILLAGRSLLKANEAVSSISKEFPSSPSKLWPLQVDIEDDDSIQKAFEEVHSKFSKVDALINNAGVQLDQQLASGKMTMRQMWNQSWNFNTTGTQIMTTIFIPLLLKSSNPRLLFITSGISTLEGTSNMAQALNHPLPKGLPKPKFGIPAYRSSKTGMNMMMREWYKTLKEDGVKVWCISPGQLATGLGGSVEANKKMGGKDPADGGKFVCVVVEGHRDADVGKVVSVDGVQAW
ncbi:NAD(P)-binding protein [Hyaloscypha variabilis]